jgi:PPOX class probable F420-dependent enzyme
VSPEFAAGFEAFLTSSPDSATIRSRPALGLAPAKSLTTQETLMPVQQGSLDLLQDPVAKELLSSNIPARLAYIGTDGAPRVVPIWFHWNGREVVLATAPRAPKVKALRKNPKVALTIDDNQFPHQVLMVRGTAHLEDVKGIVPEYALAAERYFGREQGQAWISQMRAKSSEAVRVVITPEWVGLIDFKTRFPSAIS